MNIVGDMIAVGGLDCVRKEAGRYNAVLNVADRYVDSLDVPYRHIPLVDCEPASSDDLEQAFAFLEEQEAFGNLVLVHCLAGISRSVSIVCGYIALKNGIEISAALRMVRRVRPTANPDPRLLDSVAQFVARRRA